MAVSWTCTSKPARGRGWLCACFLLFYRVGISVCVCVCVCVCVEEGRKQY